MLWGASPLLLSDAYALKCKSKIEKVQLPPTPIQEHLARDAARLAWMHMIQLKFGQQWSNPGLAANTSAQCSKHPNGIGGYTYMCTHSARPCRP
jgi:hypothetical protein